MSESLAHLRPELRAALQKASAVAGQQGFCLAGGTALTLHLGHRQSQDLDWFSSAAVGDPLQLNRELARAGVVLRNLSVERGTLHGTLDGVPVSFLEFSYPRLAPVHELAIGGATFSLDDIAAMKLSAIAQRGARKDFVDVWALVTHHRPLHELLELYRKKFDADVAPVLYGLVYRTDAEREPMPELLVDVSWSQIVADIDRWIGEVAAD